MAKGGNSARSKKSHSSKPYDVSNSFVRKVASRVTSFIPQPSWLSKWFVSSTEDKANSDDQDSDTETVSEYRSSKRPKIDLQRSFPVNSFIVAPPSDSQVATTERTENESRYSPHRAPDDPIPGPSGLNKQQVKLNTVASANLANDGISSTLDHRNIRPRPSLSTYLNQSTVSSGSVDRKINGDDVSESSESTSGCSSLPHHVAHQTSVNNSASNTKRNFDNSTPTNNRRLLLLNRTRSPRMHTPLNRRRSLFNVSAFGSPSLESDTSLSRSAVINSPFYAGRTGYGGASAYRRSHDFTSELHISRRSSIEVQPVNSGSSSKSSDMAAMSQTTRRILEALEQFASPVQDAKKMMIDSPSLPALACKRSRIDPPLSEQKSSLRQLTIPTVPDIIKLRRREKLQDSLESARLIANSAKDNSYQLRSEDNSRSGKVLGRKTNIEEEETVKEVNLPSIALPITVLPKFDIEVPPQLSPPATSVGALKFASPIMIQDFSRTASSEKAFTFCEPLSVSENHFDGKSLNTNKSLYAVKDIPVKPKMDTCISDSNVKETYVFSSLTSVSGGSQQASLFSSDPKIKSARTQTKAAEGKKPDSTPGRNVPETSPKNGEVLHMLGTPSGTVKNVSSDASWGSILKASSDTWECGTCLIRNKPSASRCIACTEPRQLPQASSRSIEQPTSISSKELDKSSKLEQAEVKTLVNDESKKVSNDVTKAVKVTWECATCWIRNPETLSKCQACETSKPKETTETSTVIGKKPADTWECPTCMIRNKNEALKCAACEEPKPGSAATTVAKSTLKFNVDIPAEASKFTFGIDKSQAMALSSTTPKGFSFGKTEGTSIASGFRFGVGDNGKSNSQNINSEKKPMFTFGVPHSVEVKAITSAMDKASGDRVCSTEDTVAKLTSAKEGNELLSEKQEKVVKTAQKSNLPSVDPQNKEKSSNVSLLGHLSDGSNKQTSESPVANFKFSMPGTSSESVTTVSSTTLFSFGSKTVANASVKTSSEENAGIMSTSEASESEKSMKSNQSESVCEITSKSEKDTSGFGAAQASTTVSSVPVTAAKTVLANKEHLTKLAEGPQANSVSCSPISIPSKTRDPGSSVSILPKSADVIASAASVPISVPQSSSSGTSLAFGVTNTVQQMFGTAVAAPGVSIAPVNFSAPLTTVQNFGNVSSSVQPSGAMTTSAAPSVGSSTPSTSSFTSIPATTTPQFGSSAALSFSTPTTTMTNFSSDKPVLNFGATAASETNSGTSVFANAPTVSAPGNTTLFGNQKSLPQQRFGTPVSTTSTFSANSAQNFGATATNLSGFGVPSTSSQQFGVPVTTPAFSLTTPAFGATGTQNFGSVTTPAPSFSSSISGTFTTKPAVDNGSKGSAPLGFSSNTSLPSLPFSFGSTQNSASDAPGPTAAKPPNFSFGAGNTSSTGQSSGFGFGNFGSTSTTPASGGPTIFGPGTAPTFGPSGNTGFTGPAFFGQNLQTNNVFGFTSNQGANGAQTSQNAASTFSFSSTQPAGPPTFNPNAKPSFNFTGGNTPTFTAEANSPAPPAQRRIKKAVRRTQARANAL